MRVPPSRRPDWNGIAIYASVQGVLFGALTIGYGAIARGAGEEFAGLLLMAAGILCGWYSWRRRPAQGRSPLRMPPLRFSRPPRRPLAMWLWVVAAWCALALSAITTNPALGAGSIIAVWACIFMVAVIEMRG